MALARVLCVIAGLACLVATLDAHAQGAALRQYNPPTPQDSTPSTDQGDQSSSDLPPPASDDRHPHWGRRDHYDHSLPAEPQYGAPQEASSTESSYIPYTPPPTPPSALDVARSNCEALRQRLETVMRAEMQGGDPAAMNRYAAERQAIYQQERSANCE